MLHPPDSPPDAHPSYQRCGYTCPAPAGRQRDSPLRKRSHGHAGWENRRAAHGPGSLHGYRCRYGPGSRWRSPESGRCPRQLVLICFSMERFPGNCFVIYLWSRPFSPCLIFAGGPAPSPCSDHTAACL